jgi:hypothetical protein
MQLVRDNLEHGLRPGQRQLPAKVLFAESESISYEVAGSQAFEDGEGWAQLYSNALAAGSHDLEQLYLELHQ